MKSFIWGLISPALGAIPFFFSVYGFNVWRKEKFEEAKSELENRKNSSPEGYAESREGFADLDSAGKSKLIAKLSKEFEREDRDARRRVRLWNFYGSLAFLIYAVTAFCAWAILLIFLPLSNS
jgi:hypothetical protein